MILSFKIGYFVYENVSNIHHSETISCTLDLEDFENENEEKNEFDETEKIHQTVIKTDFSEIVNFKSQIDKLSENYRDLYFEFTTPPPELV
ncbi:MAG: hypothetical protein ACPGUU_07910 [Flavobacteriaceae bacterium]